MPSIPKPAAPNCAGSPINWSHRVSPATIDDDAPIPAGRWRDRLQTGVGIALLVLALFLIKHVRLSRWRSTLGRLATGEVEPTSAQRDLPLARSLAGSITRADWRLPLATKCLARAAALQWRLRLAGVPSRLIIAFHRTDRQGEHAFHAWVELAHEILIGDCDRGAYQPIMTFVQDSNPSSAGSTGSR